MKPAAIVLTVLSVTHLAMGLVGIYIGAFSVRVCEVSITECVHPWSLRGMLFLFMGAITGVGAGACWAEGRQG